MRQRTMGRSQYRGIVGWTANGTKVVYKGYSRHAFGDNTSTVLVKSTNGLFSAVFQSTPSKTKCGDNGDPLQTWKDFSGAAGKINLGSAGAWSGVVMGQAQLSQLTDQINSWLTDAENDNSNGNTGSPLVAAATQLADPTNGALQAAIYTAIAAQCNDAGFISTATGGSGRSTAQNQAYFTALQALESEITHAVGLLAQAYAQEQANGPGAAAAAPATPTPGAPIISAGVPLIPGANGVPVITSNGVPSIVATGTTTIFGLDPTTALVGAGALGLLAYFILGRKKKSSGAASAPV